MNVCIYIHTHISSDSHSVVVWSLIFSYYYVPDCAFKLGNEQYYTSRKESKHSLLSRLNPLSLAMEEFTKYLHSCRKQLQEQCLWLSDGKSECLKVLKNLLQEYCDDGLLALSIYCRRLSTSINFENDPLEQKTLWF